jgi:type III secretory pathway lipoprotein EscJ
MSTTAVAELELQPANKRSALGDGFARMDQAQKLKLGLGALALLALVLAFFFMGRQPEWRVLYANLSDKDGGAIVAQLSQMNVPYKHAEGGQALMVPADKVHDTRLRLASQGLPKGSVTGFEMMEANRFGMTQFQERLTFQRGLEGELTRSIQSLSSVQSARIHLALPNQNGFFREQQKPSASVLLTLHPGRTLDRAQVAGIVHLVASSVPEMNPKAVCCRHRPTRRPRAPTRRSCSTRSRSNSSTPAASWRCWSRWWAATTSRPRSAPRSISRWSNPPANSTSPTRAPTPPPCAASRRWKTAPPPAPRLRACPAR